jgi:hypothetical protein
MSRNPLAWALHSPARFVAVLVVSIAAIVALTSITFRGNGSGPHGGSDRAPSMAKQHVAASSSAASPAPPDEEDESIGPAARRTVEKFLGHYLAPTTRHDLARLRPLCTAELWTGLKVADPGNMPAGPARRIEKIADGAFTATFTVTLPRTSLRFDVVTAPDGLRIASVEPETP